MKAVIIEDEPHARAELKRLLLQTDDSIEIITEIESVKDAISFLKAREDYDLIFLDIQLSDGLSFDIFNEVKVFKPIIFTTAYNEYAIKAFELNSVDYLLKPIEPEHLGKAIQKLKKTQAPLTNQSYTGEQLRELLGLSKKESKSRFLIKIGDQFKYISTEEIAYFFAERNTIYLVTKTNLKYIVDYRLDELEERLDPKYFFRITRSFIVHIHAIQKVHKYFNSRLLVEVQPAVEEQLLVSRIKVDAFLSWMDQ
jgi:two-component system, LytTR family, response regulator LytT